jgi:hypothetical protein
MENDGKDFQTDRPNKSLTKVKLHPTRICLNDWMISSLIIVGSSGEIVLDEIKRKKQRVDFNHLQFSKGGTACRCFKTFPALGSLITSPESKLFMSQK